MFSLGLADIVGCGSRADELRAQSMEEEEALESVGAKTTELSGKLKALKLKHSVIKKERDQLLVEKRELLTPVKDVKDEISGYLRKIKELDAQLKVEREKVALHETVVASKSDLEGHLKFSRDENRNLQMLLETSKELADSRQSRIDELEARSRADKLQMDAIKLKLESPSTSTPLSEGTTSKAALKIAYDELDAMRNKVSGLEANAVADRQQLTSLQIRLDTVVAEKQSVDLSLEIALSELSAARTRIAEWDGPSVGAGTGTGTGAGAGAGSAYSTDGEVHRLQQQIIQLTHSHEALTTQHQELESTMVRREAALVGERDTLAADKARLEIQVETLEGQLQRERAALLALQAPQNEAGTTDAALTAAREEVLACRGRIAELESQSKRDRERSSALRQEIDEMIAGRVIPHGDSPTRLADRCKAVKDKVSQCAV